jgi:histone acetyltransferase (RNA polymerase elongator complex component)
MPPTIIPIFLPYAGCRERCLFCNQKATATEIPSPSSLRSFIEGSLIQFPRCRKEEEKQVAFYGGSFTAIDKEVQISYFKEIQPFLTSGRIDSIRISTRPDALDEEILSLLKEYGVKTIELGVQSMVDEVLLLARRGHSVRDTISAVLRLKQLGFEVGLQLMIGLPADSLDRFLQTLDQVVELKPDFVRIHPTLVLRGAPLENLWRTGAYVPLSLDETIRWLKRGLLKLEAASVPVARVGLQPTNDLERDFLVGPYHPALHQLVDSAIFLEMANYLLQIAPNGSQVSFQCHPAEVSNLRGQRNQNVLRLKEEFNLVKILIHERKELPRGCLVMQTQTGEVSMQRNSLRKYCD